MNNNANYQRSMFGIIQIDADSVDTSNLICDTLVISGSGIAPTMALGNNSTNIATTEFVTNNQDILLSTSNTWTSEQTYLRNLNCNTSSTDVATTTNIYPQFGPYFTFTGTGTPAYMRLKLDGGSVGKRMCFIKANTTELITIHGEYYSGTQVYFIPIGGTQANKSTSIDFVDGDIYLELVCSSVANEWHAVTTSNLLPLNNTWTGTNAFDILPTCSVVPTTNTQLVNKLYVDTASNLLPLNNTWTGTNAFNNLPTCSVVPTTNTQLVNKLYVDNASVNLLPLNNTWTGTNTFNNGISVSGRISQDPVSIGTNSGLTSTSCTVNIGCNSGSNSTAYNVTNIGNNSGGNALNNSVSVGYNAGINGGVSGVYIGSNTASGATAGNGSICIGNAAGYAVGSNPVGQASISIGQQANKWGSGANAIAIGTNSGFTTARTATPANSICLNGSGNPLMPLAAGCYVNPVRHILPTNYELLAYDYTNSEIVYHNDFNISAAVVTCSILKTKVIESTSVSEAVSIYDNVTTGNITIADSLTTGNITVGSVAMAGDISLLCQAAGASVTLNSQVVNLNGGTVNFNVSSIDLNSSKFLNPATKVISSPLNQNTVGVDSRIASMYYYTGNTSGASRIWWADGTSLGKSMRCYKADTGNGFNFVGENVVGGSQVYFVNINSTAGSATTSITFPNNTHYIEFHCFVTNMWFRVQ